MQLFGGGGGHMNGRSECAYPMLDMIQGSLELID